MIQYDLEQRSESWYALRCGMPTASRFSNIVTSTGERSKSISTYAMTLAAELFAQKPVDAWEGNSWTERGREMEGPALELYQFATDHEVTPVGFVTDNDGKMGCSPDGLIGEDGLVEFKCLKAENHVKTILYYQKHGRCPTDYVQQTQGQVLICERKWCDLVFYHPDLPLLIIRQEPDAAIAGGLLEGITALTEERDTILAALKRQQGL